MTVSTTPLLNAYQGGTFHLKQLIKSYPNVDVAAMGFPKGWEKEPLWESQD